MMHVRAIIVVILGLLAAPAWAGVNITATGGFVVTHELLLPGSPEEIYDAVTGDISAWWDHSFSESPKALYIEPRPGGGFYEIFDDEGNGARHAVVIYADRGKILRFSGPLGLSGNAIELVCSYEMQPWVQGDTTAFKLTVSAAGAVTTGWPEVVDDVWHHFLFERLKPYLESGEHLKKSGKPLPAKEPGGK